MSRVRKTSDFLEVGARVSSKVATSRSFRDKQTSKINNFEAIILNQKWRSVTEVNHVFEMVLKGIPSSTIYFLELGSHVLLNVATKVLLELKKP